MTTYFSAADIHDTRGAYEDSSLTTDVGTAMGIPAGPEASQRHAIITPLGYSVFAVGK